MWHKTDVQRLYVYGEVVLPPIVTLCHLGGE